MARMRHIAGCLDDADRAWREQPRLAQLERNEAGALRMQAERDGMMARLRAASPLRSIATQADAAHLPLFVTANEPSLFGDAL